MIITKLLSVKRLGVFHDYAPAGDDCDFKKLNVLYGFNGSGKTTLSRVFSSIQQGMLSPLLPEGGSWQVSAEDGSIISNDSNLDLLRGRIVVFNTDFVEESFQWKQGAAKPVFYIGKEQADLGRLLQEAEASVEPARSRKALASVARGASSRLFANFKTNTARSIGEQINHRAFNATHLEREYGNGRAGAENLLKDEQRNELRSIIMQDAPLPKLLPINVELGFADFVAAVQGCLAKTAGRSALRELEEHPTMTSWVKTGQEYHQQHDLRNCLFCANEVSRDRLAALNDALDSAFEQIAEETKSLIQKAGTLREHLQTAPGKIHSKNDIIGDQQGFDAAALAYRDALKELESILDPIGEALAAKSLAPNTQIDGGRCCDPNAAREMEGTAQSWLNKLNAIIEAHNIAHDEFANTQNTARRSLLEHYLAEAAEEYKRHKAEAEGAEETFRIADEAHQNAVARVEQLTQQMRSHAPVAAVINDMIRVYLGHDEIQIVAEQEGFQLRRYGRHIATNLSEGEKTAITFCYFLSSVTADGRNLKDSIVVVDDPISSLDTKALNYAFAVIKGHLSGAKQLILLTHNVNFMNECRKWLKRKADSGDAALIFLDLKSVEGKRQTSLTKLPTLLREYDSEYHYLFSLVKAFADSGGASQEYLFLMPNAMRKVIEVFLAFKRPGNNGLGDKVDALAREAEALGLDPDRLRAIDRLVQVESHGDSLDDLVSFSSMTVEESHACASALMNIIETLDPEHHRRLCRQCP